MKSKLLANEMHIAQYDSGRFLFEADELEEFYFLAQKESEFLEFAVSMLVYLHNSDFGTAKGMRDAVGVVMNELTRRIREGNAAHGIKE